MHALCLGLAAVLSLPVVAQAADVTPRFSVPGLERRAQTVSQTNARGNKSTKLGLTIN